MLESSMMDQDVIDWRIVVIGMINCIGILLFILQCACCRVSKKRENLRSEYLNEIADYSTQPPPEPKDDSIDIQVEGTKMVDKDEPCKSMKSKRSKKDDPLVNVQMPSMANTVKNDDPSSLPPPSTWNSNPDDTVAPAITTIGQPNHYLEMNVQWPRKKDSWVPNKLKTPQKGKPPQTRALEKMVYEPGAAQGGQCELISRTLDEKSTIVCNRDAGKRRTDEKPIVERKPIFENGNVKEKIVDRKELPSLSIVVQAKEPVSKSVRVELCVMNDQN